MTARFLMRHGKFGKARIRMSPKFPRAVWFGVHGSEWFTRAYPKPSVNGFRVEVQENRAALEKSGVRTARDIAKLESLVAGQVGFFKVDWRKLTCYVRRLFRYPDTFLRDARAQKGNLCRLLTFMRIRSVKNPRRFLIQLPETHQVREALRNWGQEWRSGVKNEGLFRKDEREESMKAKLQNGVLTIKLPLDEEATMLCDKSIIACTWGPRRTNLSYDGRRVYVMASAFYSMRGMVRESSRKSAAATKPSVTPIQCENEGENVKPADFGRSHGGDWSGEEEDEETAIEPAIVGNRQQ